MTSQDVSGHENARNEGGQGTSPDTNVTKECVEITERFRAGTITKVSAILALQRTIPQETETTYLEALGAYLRVLGNFEHIRERTSRIEGSREPSGNADNKG